ncbi:uncharacterized mitochondrial protein AtMg00820-like [Phaseolus vulgaris]|uniref:uncharacterized mitochondrial protein AtMg00820-like n=1 Tax=Phaseolus vulgaris TaxID=3885 RepID=UPI0035C9ADCB
MVFVSQVEPKSIDEALKDENWIVAMHEELNQFIKNDVWFLVPKTNRMNIIGTKWVFRNKEEELGVITRNKARLVAKAYNQEEGVRIYGLKQEGGSLCKEFVAAMQGEFEMSMMGELSFFLGLHVKKSKDDIFLSQSKYCKEILKKFEMEKCKEATTPMSISYYMDGDAAGKAVDQDKYRGCKLDKKSTSGTCHLLGLSLISWHNKKQACVALSTAEAV